MALFTYPAQQVSITGVATEATLLDVKTNTADTVTELQTANSTLGLVDSNTSSAVTELQNANGTLTNIDSQLANLATESTLQDLNNKTAGALVPVAFDEIQLTYVTSGNGIGEIATAVYKSSSTTVATLTMTYDSNNKLTNVVKS